MGGSKGTGPSGAPSNTLGLLFPPEVQAGLTPTQNQALGSIEQQLSGLLSQSPSNAGTTTITSSGNPSQANPQRPMSLEIPVGLLTSGGENTKPLVGGGKG